MQAKLVRRGREVCRNGDHDPRNYSPNVYDCPLSYAGYSKTGHRVRVVLQNSEVSHVVVNYDCGPDAMYGDEATAIHLSALGHACHTAAFLETLAPVELSFHIPAGVGR